MSFGIGIINVKAGVNVGTLWRSAWQLGASFVFTVGRRYKRQSSDTYCTPRNIPLWHWDGPEDMRVPHAWPLIGIDYNAGKSTTLPDFKHPRSAVYLLGAEDHGLPAWAIERCVDMVAIPAVRNQSYNVAVAGSLVMYDRLLQRGTKPQDTERPA